MASRFPIGVVYVCSEVEKPLLLTMTLRSHPAPLLVAYDRELLCTAAAHVSASYSL